MDDFPIELPPTQLTAQLLPANPSMAANGRSGSRSNMPPPAAAAAGFLPDPRHRRRHTDFLLSSSGAQISDTFIQPLMGYNFIAVKALY